MSLPSPPPFTCNALASQTGNDVENLTSVVNVKFTRRRLRESGYRFVNLCRFTVKPLESHDTFASTHLGHEESPVSLTLHLSSVLWFLWLQRLGCDSSFFGTVDLASLGVISLKALLSHLISVWLPPILAHNLTQTWYRKNTQTKPYCK